MARPKEVSDEAIVDVLSGANPVPLTTSEVAEHLPIGSRATFNRLNALHREGKIGKKEIGVHGVVWYVKRSRVSVSESVTYPEPDWDAIEDAVRNANLPGRGEKFERRVEAVLACVNYLVQHETATPTDFKKEVYPDHRADYTVGKDPRLSWWKNAVYPGLRHLSEQEFGILRPDSSGKWKYHPIPDTSHSKN